MRARVKSEAGYYATVEGKPTWVNAQAAAKVFRTIRLARGVVAILRFNRIRATVEQVCRNQ
jgi:hypothetical protein